MAQVHIEDIMNHLSLEMRRAMAGSGQRSSTRG